MSNKTNTYVGRLLIVCLNDGHNSLVYIYKKYKQYFYAVQVIIQKPDMAQNYVKLKKGYYAFIGKPIKVMNYEIVSIVPCVIDRHKVAEVQSKVVAEDGV